MQQQEAKNAQNELVSKIIPDLGGRAGFSLISSFTRRTCRRSRICIQ